MLLTSGHSRYSSKTFSSRPRAACRFQTWARVSQCCRRWSKCHLQILKPECSACRYCAKSSTNACTNHHFAYNGSGDKPSDRISCGDAARKPKFLVALEDYELEPKWLGNITNEHVVWIDGHCALRIDLFIKAIFQAMGWLSDTIVQDTRFFVYSLWSWFCF